MTDTIQLTVTIDSDELRLWAGRHADAGHAGVAHVLYQAATDVESLSVQAIREAKEEAWDEALQARAGWMQDQRYYSEDEVPNPYRADRIEQGGQP